MVRAARQLQHSFSKVVPVRDKRVRERQPLPTRGVPLEQPNDNATSYLAVSCKDDTECSSRGQAEHCTTAKTCESRKALNVVGTTDRDGKYTERRSDRETACLGGDENVHRQLNSRPGDPQRRVRQR